MILIIKKKKKNEYKRTVFLYESALYFYVAQIFPNICVHAKLTVDLRQC